MPPGYSRTYMSVVHGATRKPTSGHRNVSNVSLQRIGWTSHQNRIAARGPNANSAAITQHIGRTLQASSPSAIDPVVARRSVVGRCTDRGASETSTIEKGSVDERSGPGDDRAGQEEAGRGLGLRWAGWGPLREDRGPGPRGPRGVSTALCAGRRPGRPRGGVPDGRPTRGRRADRG